VGKAEADSVHLTRFPVADESLIDCELEARMGQVAQKVTSMVLALRRKANIKVRQPLQCIMIPPVDQLQKERVEAVTDIILSEVNVKQLQFAEGENLLVKKVKCNFRVMGKKYGKLMKAVAATMGALPQDDIARLEQEGTLSIDVEGQQVVVEADDVEIISEDIPGWLVANEGNLTVALEVELNETLVDEGLARELINRVQNLRKESGLEITDRIRVAVTPCKPLEKAMASHGEYVKTQVLADEFKFEDNDGTPVEFDDFTLNIKVEKNV
jgi:isoleucyl-tRNA synthetase